MAKTIEDVDPVSAAKTCEQNPQAVIVDVRSRVEFDYVGHPRGAVHVPWKEYPDWQENPDFCAEVDAALEDLDGGADKNRPLLMICRSGARSRAAGQKLLDHGYRTVVNIAEGFEGDKDANDHRGTINGWRFHGLPWEQT